MADAQLAAELLNPGAETKVLDACAAPGGKTCHLLERYSGLNQDLDLTAIDIDASRIEKVRSNLDRLKLKAKVFCGDAANPDGLWSETQYDAVLLDVPCSATGVIRRHPDINKGHGKLIFVLPHGLDSILPLAAQGQIKQNGR